jgi:hypothetical protein
VVHESAQLERHAFSEQEIEEKSQVWLQKRIEDQHMIRTLDVSVTVASVAEAMPDRPNRRAR